MEQVPLETLIDKTAYSVYKLVILASRRALEIAEAQQRAGVAADLSTKPTTAALEEIAEGKIRYKDKK